MAAKKQLPFDFIVEQLEKNNDATYAEIRSAAERRGLQIYPINYGRAKLMLGLVEGKPVGRKKGSKARQVAKPARAETPSAAAPVRRGPGRPRKQPAADVGGITSIVEQVRRSDAERQRYRRALEKVQSILRDLG